MTIEEILAAFAGDQTTYPRAAVDAALEQGEAIVPALLNILQKTLDDPDDTESSDYIYALLILGHMRAPAAHDLIVDLFSLPEETVTWLFNDIITEELSFLLLRTCGGSLKRVQELVANQAAYDFCRSAAADTLCYAVVEGWITRQEALDFLVAQFDEIPDGTEEDVVWSLLASSIYDLYPTPEALAVLRQADEQGLIDSMLFEEDAFTAPLDPNGEEDALAKLRQSIARHDEEDFHRELAYWVEPPPSLADVVKLRPSPPKPDQKAAAKAKKKKRKQAKASRRTNRRK